MFFYKYAFLQVVLFLVSYRYSYYFVLLIGCFKVLINLDLYIYYSLFVDKGVM